MARKWKRTGLWLDVVAGDVDDAAKGQEKDRPLDNDSIRDKYRELLTTLAPEAESEAIERASYELLEARQSYLSGFPVVYGRIVDEYSGKVIDTERPVRQTAGLSEARKDLKNLLKKVRQLEKLVGEQEKQFADIMLAVRSLSFGAKKVFHRCGGPLSSVNAAQSIGTVLGVVRNAAAAGIKLLENEPDHSANLGIVCLAGDVYGILCGTLGLKVAMSTDEKAVKPTSANYAKTLRLVLSSCGTLKLADTSMDALRVVMQKGRAIHEASTEDLLT